ncbi:unnamed protein product [Brachionus calyciflorus]|uniref:EF-hand domain-containing protein n=1 Tax=Brachionus calyciflorus TaxID=104777 RepID=A0A813YUC1_9BILA|nr:unnamed protein product [Brachionus calyciflorus]
MADLLSPEQQELFKQAFNEIDKDGDGRITSTELGDVFRATGLNHSDEEVKKMIAEIDTNNNGTIEFNEFLSMIANKFGSLKN